MAARLPKAFVSWSSGKDSAYVLLEARRQSVAEIVPFRRFVSGRKIPFPGNGDRRRSGDSVRMRRLLRRKAKHLVLTGPFSR